MTYSVSAIADISEIPALAKSFAQSLGFLTGGEGTVSIRHPTYVGAKTFSLWTTSVGSAATLRERVYIGTDVTGIPDAAAESPKLNPTSVNNAAAVVVVKPTSLHLFGELRGDAEDADGSFIAGVIEYGFNLYRHFYLGYVDKTTPFNGGEVTTGSAFAATSRGNSTTSFDNLTATRYPFSAVADISNGGLHVDHAGVVQPGFEFPGLSIPNTDIDAAFSSTGNRAVLGGYLDSINSGYVAAGKSAYSGAQILTPVNLYIGKREGSTQFFQPVGAPGGVRMVHLEDLEPGAQVNIGASTWMVFPVFSKDSRHIVPAPGFNSANSFPAFNTSYYVGMAYRVSE